MPKVSFGIDKAKKRRDKLRYILKRYTQCEIAAKLGISQSSVSMKLKKCQFSYEELATLFEDKDISDAEIIQALRYGA